MLARRHDRDGLLTEISDIRRRLANFQETGNPWETRQRPGGLAELELAAEYLQLANAHATPGVLVHGLAATFEAAGEHRLIDAGTAAELAQAATLWQNLEGYFRMTCGGEFRPEDASGEQQEVIAEMCGVQRFGELSGLLPETALATARALDRLFAP